MEITPHLHQLTIPFTVPLPTGPVERSVNLFLVTGERITLIDSGVAGAEEPVFAYLHRLGRHPEEIDTLVLTHSHPDHIGAALPIQERSGCRVLVHAAERDWVEDTALQAAQRPVPGFATLVAGPVPVDRCLADGERLPVADAATFEVLHTPGHSRGSISLWDRENGLLITGDAVPVPGDLPILEDFGAAKATLERLRSCDARLLLSSWDRPRRRDEVNRCLDDGLAWLRRIKETVRTSAGTDASEPLELCRRVVPLLGLPPQAVNPLVARSFQACLAG